MQNDRGERIFHIDTSPTDDLGNDLAEAEFPHSQFGAEHISNLKQAVKWMATLGVKPQDFTAAIWTRNNRDELEKLVEFDSEELEARVDELESAVGSVARDASEKREVLWDAVGDMDQRVEMLEARVDDTVGCVDATREEFQRKHGVLEDAVESNQRVGQRIAETLGQVSQSMQGRDRALLEEIRELRQRDQLRQQDMRERRRQMLEEQRRMRELMERTIWDKARETVEAVASRVKRATGRIMGEVSASDGV